uniref:Alpha-L-iduronidase n=1 Tax=Culex pipiens TaxID=7175 RepID=A0A8D8BRM3_CULPI
MLVLLRLLFVVAVANGESVHHLDLNLEEVLQNGKPLHRFWTSTGLCPPAPRERVAEFLLSEDSLRNLEIIAALPNRGIKHVRIHWLLEMIRFSHYDDKKTIFYDFSKLDAFLDKLHEFGLYPGIELMGVPQGIYERESKRRFEYFWTDLTMQLAARYLHRYGIKSVLEWRFETWNEPDLKGYNVLNFTNEEYISYVQSTRLGLDGAGRLFNNLLHIPLRGPAGLFKAELHHPFCWGILELCNERPHKCPFEVLSFHRKGSGARADEILDGGLQLMDQIWERFPNLSGFKVSNDEADPIAGWSTPREFQSNVKYGAMLVSTVLQHWSAKFQGRFANLESISHDNAFLSYHPFEFDQRTLLARFQMNETHPREVQFVAKPVYSALGMLSSLGSLATDVIFEKDNLSYVISYDIEPFYASIILTQSNDTFEPLKKRTTLTMNITLPTSSSRIAYVVEGLQAGLNDPSGVWKYYGRPPYPTREQFAEMRSAQFPSVIFGPRTLESGVEMVSIVLSLRVPWVVNMRFCSEKTKPTRIVNVRIRKVNSDEVAIFWSDAVEQLSSRCILTYEVWHRNNDTEWKQVNKDNHTPFMFYQFVVAEAGSTGGHYRVRSVDLFGRVGAFSKTHYYDG